MRPVEKKVLSLPARRALLNTIAVVRSHQNVLLDALMGLLSLTEDAVACPRVLKS